MEGGGERLAGAFPTGKQRGLGAGMRPLPRAIWEMESRRSSVAHGNPPGRRLWSARPAVVLEESAARIRGWLGMQLDCDVEWDAQPGVVDSAGLRL